VSGTHVPALGMLPIHMPQFGQIRRRLMRPLSAMLSTIRVSPDRRTASVGTTIPIENALLVMRWQSAQWHVYTAIGG
jgi:hypothetical protein